MNIKKIKVGDLKNWAQNPREIDTSGIEALKKYLTKYGLLDPLLVDGRDNVTVLGGNMRLRAIRELGWEEVDCNVIEIADDDQALEVALLDNNQFGQYVKGQLIDLIRVSEIDLGDFKIDLKPVSLDSLMPHEVEEDDFEVPDEDEIETDIVLGDMFKLGNHRLLCGDATKIEDVEKLMDGQKADMVFTDPPYNVDYEGKTKDALKIENDKFDTSDSFYQFLYDAFTNLFVSTGDGCPIYVCHADSEGLNFRKAFQDAGYLLKQCVIWNKNTMVMGRQDYQWKHEPILYGWKSGEAHKWYGGRNKYTVWDIEKPSRSGEHPTMKPLELVSIAIQNSSKHNDLVLDTFGGSGSTLIACEQTDRKCYMMEIDPKYCQVIINRWEKLTELKAEKIDG